VKFLSHGLPHILNALELSLKLLSRWHLYYLKIRHTSPRLNCAA